MNAQIVSLEQLCKVLADAVSRSDVLRSQFERSGGDTAFTYRMEGDAPQSLRRISHDALHHRHGYGISELDFNVPCCIETRTVGGETQAVLILRIPGWWGRMGRRLTYGRLQIRVSPQGTMLKLHPLTRRRVSSGGSPWIMPLSPEQHTMLITGTGRDDRSNLADGKAGNLPSTDSISKPVAGSLLRRFSYYFRRHR